MFPRHNQTSFLISIACKDFYLQKKLIISYESIGVYSNNKEKWNKYEVINSEPN